MINRMKCSKKKIIIFSIMTLIGLFIIFACVLLIPSAKEIVKKPYPWTNRCPSGNCNVPVERFVKPSIRGICTTKECLMTNAVTKPGTVTRGLCTWDDCVVEAANILKFMDPDVDPCEDFYNFSCGNFFRIYSIPEGWNYYATRDVAYQKVDYKIKTILETPVKINESDALVKAKKLFKSCMDVSYVEEQSLEDMKYLLSGKGIGEWPFLDPDWQDCRLDLEWRMAKLNALGIDSLFKLNIRFKGDQQKAFAYLSPAPPIVKYICYKDYENATLALEEASKHKEILTSILTLMEVEINNVTEQDIDDVFIFDFTFCNLTKKARKQSLPHSEPTKDNQTLKDIIDIAPEINWVRWRNIIFSELQLNFPHDKLNIYVHNLDSTIQSIIELLHTTSSKILANYLTYKFVLHHLGFLGRPFQQIVENHLNIDWKLDNFMKPDREYPRWQQCVRYVEKLMPFAVLPPYLRAILTPDMQREMDYVVSAVKNEFRDIFRKSTILQRNEKVKSIHKIDQIDIQLFYPDREKKFFDKYYSDMGRMGESFLKNSIKVKMSHTKRLMEGAFFMKTFYDLEYRAMFDSLFEPEASSGFLENKIILYLGELEKYKISSRLPRFLSMSTLGFTIGHELAHGFDISSINTVYRRSYRNWTVWPEYVLRHAVEKAQCFVDQYALKRNVNESQHPILSTFINDDLSDNQGIYLAYKAYMNYLMNYGEEKYLPGFPYSNEQLFFIRFAQGFCALVTPHFNLAEVHHSPPSLRVNEVLKNFAPFSEHFRCSPKDPMNPRTKCENIWV